MIVPRAHVTCFRDVFDITKFYSVLTLSVMECSYKEARRQPKGNQASGYYIGGDQLGNIPYRRQGDFYDHHSDQT
jgi:hypothetical protein